MNLIVRLLSEIGIDPGTRKWLGNVLTSIFIGACVAFITSFASGIVHVLQGLDHSALGSTAASITYLAKAYGLAQRG